MLGLLANKHINKTQATLLLLGTSLGAVVLSTSVTLFLKQLNIISSAFAGSVVQLILVLTISSVTVLVLYGFSKKVLLKLVLLFAVSLVLFYRPYFPAAVDPEVYISKNIIKSQSIAELGNAESSFQGEVLASAEDSLCETGDYNWKRRDKFSKKCTYRHTIFVGTETDVKKALIQFESAILVNGWKMTDSADFTGIEAHLNRTFTELYGQKFRNFPEGYPLTSAAGLGDIYQKNGLTIDLLAAEIDNANDEDTAKRLQTAQQILGSINNTYSQDSNFVSSTDLEKFLEMNRYVIAISVEGEYAYKHQVLLLNSN